MSVTINTVLYDFNLFENGCKGRIGMTNHIHFLTLAVVIGKTFHTVYRTKHLTDMVYNITKWATKQYETNGHI